MVETRVSAVAKFEEHFDFARGPGLSIPTSAMGGHDPFKYCLQVGNVSFSNVVGPFVLTA